MTLGDLWFDLDVDGWPLVMAVVTGAGCGALGAVFLLRRKALLGDAVSHSVLPGVAAGLLFFGMFSSAADVEVFGVSPAMLWILAGALAAATLSTALIEMFHRFSRIKEDAALGAVFPAFFAVGVILIEALASGVHFDADCIFYGSLEVIGRFSQVVPTLIATTLVVAFLWIAHKEILVASFDPGLARALGMKVRLVNLILILLLAAVVVSAFEAVGAILVVAVLIMPPATAYLLSDRFHNVVLLASLFGATAGALGCWLTIVLEVVGFQTARAPTMAVVAGLQFLLSFLCGPRRGLITQARRRRRLERRILDENFLGALYRLASGPRGASLEATAEALAYGVDRLRPAFRRALRRREVTTEGDEIRLTEEGRSRVETIMRAHRLWESYMTSEMGAAPDHVHDAADEVEHYLQPALVQELEKVLDYPDSDPHGKTIPRK